MTSIAGFWRRRLLGIAPEETSFTRRGFHSGLPHARAYLEAIPGVFVAAYHATLDNPALTHLVPKLEAFEPVMRGFAYEGAAMALALLDRLTPWNRHRVADFLAGAGARHTYMVHAGLGWVLARWPGRIEPHLARLDPLLRWLAVDGYGFHDGFFHWPRCQGGGPLPKRLAGYARRAFDQGLGRCLWFVDGADVARLPRTILGFPEARRPDLWSGVGLASLYAGGVGQEDLCLLREAAGPWRPCLAQGAAFAAKARLHAGLVVPHTRLASDVLCGLSVEDAAGLTDQTRLDLPPDAELPAYEIWRQRLQSRFTQLFC